MMLVLAVALAGLAWLRFTTGSDGTATAAAPPPPPPPSVLVAERPIPAGTLLRPEDVTWRDWSGRDVPAGALLRGSVTQDDVAGAVARRGFGKDEPLLAPFIIHPGERGFLAAVLTPGNRAAAISVDAVTAASGLIWPGDHVDVILTQTFGENEAHGQKAAGETLVRDVRVIAIDQRLGDPVAASGQGKTDIPHIVSIEVTPAQAEAIAVAANLGRLTLSLRSLGETAAAEPPVRRATWASEVSSALARGAAVRPVQVLRGSTTRSAPADAPAAAAGAAK
jgi:pilus assembly protein CpaB